MSCIRDMQYKIKLKKFVIRKCRKNYLGIVAIKGGIMCCYCMEPCDMMNQRRFTMYTKQPPKMLIINMLDILKRYTDENHRLSQREIMDILEQDMKVDRKAVKRNLLNLIDFGYQVEYSESIRQGKNGEEEIVFTDWYLEKDFTDSEPRLLIDSLLFSKHIPYSQCKALIEKSEGLSNCYFNTCLKRYVFLE